MACVSYSTLTLMVLTGNMQRPTKQIHQGECMNGLIPSTVDASRKAQYVLNTRKPFVNLKILQTSLHFSVAQTKSYMRLEETEGFSLQWQSTRHVCPTRSTLAAGRPCLCTHSGRSPCFLAKGSSGY